MKYLFSLFALLALSPTAEAQDFVYRAKNPAFGGETFNYNWLISSAQSQNGFTDPTNPFGREEANPLDDFTESLNRQLLNQISNDLIQSQFGEQGLQEGDYTVGNFNINVTNTLEGIVVTIFDTAIGQQTQLIVPFF